MNHVECAVMLYRCLAVCGVADTELNLIIKCCCRSKIPPTLIQRREVTTGVLKVHTCGGKGADVCGHKYGGLGRPFLWTASIGFVLQRYAKSAFFFKFFYVIFIHNQYQIKWTDYSRQRINTYINTEIKFETGYSFPLA